MTTAIRRRELRKSFGTQVVLDGIDLDMVAGAVFSLLGSTGAGKTTALQILSTLVPAATEEVRVRGHDLRADAGALREAIGVTGRFSAATPPVLGRLRVGGASASWPRRRSRAAAICNAVSMESLGLIERSQASGWTRCASAFVIAREGLRSCRLSGDGRTRPGGLATADRRVPRSDGQRRWSGPHSRTS